ncbi:hypothetical protein RhiirC2_738660 [Rhizophagus irregularis]|uniref:TLDc domain-containing protein n=1 Tax=Rhizophagus irregularis TaxID=588596 RepID=A0A2N1NKZ0_9GLOM|nr:hypothetical protein RhiirC2_738660 [Rhizophagus irregularis]
MKISRVNSSNYAIHENHINGFNFGGGTFRMDSNQIVYFRNTGYYDNVDNVLSPYLNINFVPEEIEVFKITTS